MDKKVKQTKLPGKKSAGCGLGMCFGGANVTVVEDPQLQQKHRSRALPPVPESSAASQNCSRQPPSGKSATRSQTRLAASVGNYHSRYLPMGGHDHHRRRSGAHTAVSMGTDNYSYLGSSERICGGSASVISAATGSVVNIRNAPQEDLPWHSTPCGRSRDSSGNNSTLYMTMTSSRQHESGSQKTSSGYGDSCSDASSLQIDYLPEDDCSSMGHSAFAHTRYHDDQRLAPDDVYHVDYCEEEDEDSELAMVESNQAARYLQQLYYQQRARRAHAQAEGASAQMVPPCAAVTSQCHTAVRRATVSSVRRLGRGDVTQERDLTYSSGSSLDSLDASGVSVRSKRLSKRMKHMRSYIHGHNDPEESCFEVLEEVL